MPRMTKSIAWSITQTHGLPPTSLQTSSVEEPRSDGLRMVILVRFPFNSLFRSDELRETDSIIVTAVDVNIYASNPKHVRPLIGNHENTDIGVFLREYLDVDTKAVTKELKEQLTITSSRFDENWLGKPVDEARTMAELDHYEGDFKRSLECECGAVH